MKDDNATTKRELEEMRTKVQRELEKWEIERAELRRDLDEERSARKQLENDIKLERLRSDVSRLQLELEFTKRFNDQGRKHGKAMQDLKDMHCAEWKGAAEEAQKAREQLQSLLTMQKREDNTANKAQEDIANAQPGFINRLNEQINENTRALQDMRDRPDEEPKRAADAYQAAQGCGDAQITVKELKKGSLAPLTASNANRMVVSSSLVGEVDAAAFCLITPPIAPGIDKSEMAVASVKFTLQSHDQGYTVSTMFGSPEGTVGAYEGSHTWFQAAIVRDNNPDVATMLLGMGWHIQHNIYASSETRTHVVTWSDSSPTGIRKVWGSGTGSGFLSALAPGDRIAVIARAKAGGWVNYVGGVEVQVTFSA